MLSLFCRARYKKSERHRIGRHCNFCGPLGLRIWPCESRRSRSVVSQVLRSRGMRFDSHGVRIAACAPQPHLQNAHASMHIGGVVLPVFAFRPCETTKPCAKRVRRVHGTPGAISAAILQRLGGPGCDLHIRSHFSKAPPQTGQPQGSRTTGNASWCVRMLAGASNWLFVSSHFFVSCATKKTNLFVSCATKRPV